MFFFQLFVSETILWGLFSFLPFVLYFFYSPYLYFSLQLIYLIAACHYAPSLFM